MAALALRKSTWDSASDRDQTIFRTFGRYLKLGDPAKYRDSGGIVWYVFDDDRWEANQICYFACLAANAGNFPPGYSVAGKAEWQIREDATFWLEGGGGVEGGADPVDRGLKLPGQIKYPDPNANYWQSLLDANGAPAWLKMADSVPANWTVVEAD
jgi:hypothetical protein